MLPGDYIAFKMTGEVSTTVSGLSEGIFWDYQNRFPAYALMDFWGISASLMPNIVPTFGEQGRLTEDIAGVLGLKAGTPLSYRAGDQPNNAFSLNVLNAGEAAATAGTSGVIYGVTERALNDSQSRVNTFVHVNNDLHNDRPSTHETERNGILLCINGTGSLNAWLKRNLKRSYEEMNAMASEVPIGAKGLNMLPFGNGAERVLGNKMLGAQMLGLDFNTHDVRHIARAAQEGIVFALNYGFEVMKEIGLSLHTIRAGHANMFLSPMFRDAFVQTTGATLDLYHTDGAQGAARGAGFGCGFYSSLEEAFVGLTALKHEEPEPMRQTLYQEAYQSWKQVLEKAMRDHDAKDQD
jgi:xylulokinase